MSEAALLERLTYAVDTTKIKLAPIPWPEGLAPTPVDTENNPRVSLPAADVLVVTWTVAEAQALADVLTPGHPSDTWVKYEKGFSKYANHLTWKSPAREAKCLATYWPITIGDTKVLCVKSELHLATDDKTMPLRGLWKQMIEDTGAKLVLTTGTAGGIGADTVEGDVQIADVARFDCQKTFRGQSFSQQSFGNSAHPIEITPDADLDALLAVNAGQLAPIATRAPQVTNGQVLTTDFFAFDTQGDHYGLRAYDPTAGMVEMDDASLGLACAEDMTDPPLWLSIRNASDPQVPSSEGSLDAQSSWAAGIYKKYGYWTTVGSAIVTWAVIVSYSKGTV